jgi:hypothetical protein
LYGKDAWKHVDAGKRKQVFSDLSGRLSERKHDVIISTINTSKSTAQNTNAHQIPDELSKHLWVAAGLNVAVQLQAKHRGERSNTGNTFLSIDDNCQRQPELCKLLWAPLDGLKGYHDSSGKRRNWIRSSIQPSQSDRTIAAWFKPLI